MIKQLFEPPHRRHIPDDAVLWRYVPLRTLFVYLNRRVFIPSVTKLEKGDPFEGGFHPDPTEFMNGLGPAGDKVVSWIQAKRCTKAEQDNIKAYRLKAKGSKLEHRIYLKRYFEFISRTRFAWCWFQSPNESVAMWNHYGRDGAAVMTTFGQLKKALEPLKYTFTAAKMNYIHHALKAHERFDDPTLKSYLLLRPFFLKRQEYESEREIRFVASARPRWSASDGGGIALRDFHPKGWIAAVRLWPDLKKDEEEAIQARVWDVVPDISCRKSDLFDAATRTIKDEMLAELDENCEEGWASVGDDIPCALKQI